MLRKIGRIMNNAGISGVLPMRIVPNRINGPKTKTTA